MPEPIDPDLSHPPRAVLHLDSVAACVARADPAGWTAEERARLMSITDPARRDEYAAGHWRVRGLASVVFGGAPADWRWTRPEGEPARLQDRRRGTSCYASISHGGDALVCAVSDEVVGVDIQAVQSGRDLESLARRCLAPDEAQAVAQLQGDEQAAAFYRGWAMREALGKAAGTGLVPGTARRMQISPAPEAEATLRLWAAPDRVIALAHAAGARIDARFSFPGTVECFMWDMS